LIAQLPWSPRGAISVQVPSRTGDRTWAVLERDLRSAYARAFPLVFSRRTFTASSAGPTEPTNVVLIVMESLRPDAFTPERMPRLYAWARRGLVAEQHYAGSNSSEAGLFSLLYGRSPLLYHFVLDNQQPPVWCEVAHRFGMTCEWYSGQPVVWMRQEEFVNAKLVDRFVHDDRGDWEQWDRTALEHAVAATKNPRKPAFAVAYLMSTHFEYRYPASYERHLPVLTTARYPDTNELKLGPEARVPLTNRYLNALAFSDDLIADAIDRLDSARTLVILTGDHGEALGESEHFGHGFGFPDGVARVPFALVGPGIPAGSVRAPSLHADVLRTVVHLLGGRSTGPAETRDMLARTQPPRSLLLAHGSFEQDSADALFIHGARRIRLTLGLRSSDLTIVGPEDAHGRPTELNPLSELEAADLRQAFEAELEALWRN
jgi:membrane-anchored protein YejM (alkaline phosphatase superfamily)